jgi:nucleoid DNA-binding protein
MTKRELVVRVSNETGIKQTVVKQVFESSLKVIAQTLSEGGRVELRDFGIFKIKLRKKRKGRNPRTGKEVPIPPKKVAHFKPGKALKESVK